MHVQVDKHLDELSVMPCLRDEDERSPLQLHPLVLGSSCVVAEMLRQLWIRLP